MPPPKKSHLSNLSVIAYAMPPLLVGEALAVRIKHNFFAKGSPTRKDSPGRGRWHIRARKGTAVAADD